MLEPGILTIVAPILEGWKAPSGECLTHAPGDTSVPPINSLTTLLRSQMDPGWLSYVNRQALPPDEDPRDGQDTGTRQDAFRFGQLRGLHCCAFVVVPGGEKPGFLCETVKLEACLIMEATFDGPLEGFLQDLIATHSEQLVAIFGHCKGFPQNAHRHPELLADFLTRKAVGHSTYFSGIPGRSVSEIKTEANLRRKLSGYLETKFGPQNASGTVPRPHAQMEVLQNELRAVVRSDRELRMAEERPSDPWSVRNGTKVITAAALGLAAVFLLMAAWCVSATGYGVFAILAGVTHILFADPILQLSAIACLVGGWGVVRLLRWGVTPIAHQRLLRGKWYLVDEILQLCLLGIHVGIIAFGLAVALTYAGSGHVLGAAHWSVEIFGWIAIIALAGFVMYEALQIRVKPARVVEDGPRATLASRWVRARNQGIVDAMDLVRRLWCLLMWVPLLGIVDVILLEPVFGRWVWLPMALLAVAVTGAIYGLVAFVLFLGIKNAILWFASALQWFEMRKAFLPAETLADRNLGHGEIWAREEHRTHLNQNHFASMTLVKSFPRMLYLRLALWLVNFLARYVDNKGKLGGIPTIFSARWVLLDKGHRLIFLTNYVGAWDSYLGEFSDLNAYIGVNAIWTNTYVPLSASDRDKLQAEKHHRGVSFPSSSLLLFKGAALEQPFKAYVRQSQLETLCWYGAYPNLSVPNMNDNSRIRRDLFRDLSTPERAALLQRI